MRKISTLGLLLFGFWVSAQLRWYSIEEAIASQKIYPKKIIISFFSNNCKPCRELEEQTFGHPALVEYLNTHYYLVRFNTDSSKDVTLLARTFKGKTVNQNRHEFASFMNISTTPSIVFLDENSAFITLIQGKLSPQEIEPYILFMNSKHYKKVSDKRTWESYMSGFKPKLTK